MNALAPRQLTLGELLAGFGEHLADDDAGRPVLGLSSDSRAVTAGDLFVALRGEHHDGHDYLEGVAAAGAAAALVEDPVAVGPKGLPLIPVDDLRQRLGEIAARFFGHPSRAMHLCAVTGTNGKTTVSQLLAQLTAQSGLARFTKSDAPAEGTVEVLVLRLVIALLNEDTVPVQKGTDSDGTDEVRPRRCCHCASAL